MIGRRTPVVAGAIAVVMSLLLALPAFAALPRTYQVQRVDSPFPVDNGGFGIAMVSAGDLNADGKLDLLVGSDKHGTRAGQVFVINGVDGSLIRELQLPAADADPPPVSGGDRPSGFGAAVTRLGLNASNPSDSATHTDVGSCPGGISGASPPFCADANVGPTDGIPDIAVSASGVDVDPATGAANAALNNDLGRIYVYDGATGALLKRIQMPAADRTQQDGFGDDPRYGRTLLSPSGLPPCQRNGGLAACPTTGTMSLTIQMGDLDGAGKPDLVVGATDYIETLGNAGSAHPESGCFAAAGPGNCDAAGRAYIHTGESIAGDPTVVLDTPLQTIKNRAATPDVGEASTDDGGLATLLIPVGAVGRCTDASPTPGSKCVATTKSSDTRPDYVLSSSATDLYNMPDVGLAQLMDGATGTVLKTYEHPEPQPGAAFGLTQNGVIQPAFGDLGQTAEPDFYVPSLHQNVGSTATGRGYALNGNLTARLRFTPFAQFNDPTPNGSGQFGASAAGVGQLEGDPHGELLIGATGPHAPGTNQNVLNDVHIFEPITETPLQTISDPDQQGGSSFGTGLVPLGDTTGDGFLDFAVGAGFWDGVKPDNSPRLGQGRIYLFDSDNSPAPPGTAPASPPAGPQGPAGAAGQAGQAGQAIVLAGRDLEIEASRNRVIVRRGRSSGRSRRVRMTGALEAFANDSRCEPSQAVELQRRIPGSLRYRTFRRLRTSRTGGFSTSFTPARTYIYRARVGGTSECQGAISNRERVTVLRRR